MDKDGKSVLTFEVMDYESAYAHIVSPGSNKDFYQFDMTLEKLVDFMERLQRRIGKQRFNYLLSKTRERNIANVSASRKMDNVYAVSFDINIAHGKAFIETEYTDTKILGGTLSLAATRKMCGDIIADIAAGIGPREFCKLAAEEIHRDRGKFRVFNIIPLIFTQEDPFSIYCDILKRQTSCGWEPFAPILIDRLHETNSNLLATCDCVHSYDILGMCPAGARLIEFAESIGVPVIEKISDMNKLAEEIEAQRIKDGGQRCQD